MSDPASVEVKVQKSVWHCSLTLLLFLSFISHQAGRLQVFWHQQATSSSQRPSANRAKLCPGCQCQSLTTLPDLKLKFKPGFIVMLNFSTTAHLAAVPSYFRAVQKERSPPGRTVHAASWGFTSLLVAQKPRRLPVPRPRRLKRTLAAPAFMEWLGYMSDAIHVCVA